MDPSAYLSALHANWLAGGIDGTWAYLEGTLVFADVSGFTSLSERLARRGRAGAEELTDIIDDVVGGLLEVAEPRGGDLLKYGGDALLLSFTGPGHEHRAAAAAAGMQAALRQFRARPTAAGRVTLRMSIGADAGRFLVCLAGDSHRELVVLGPGVTRVAALESAASAGQILLGPDLAAALPAGCVRMTDAGALLRSPPLVTGSAPPPEPVRGDLLLGIPMALRPHLGTTADGEHRHAVVAFVQFRGSDARLRHQGPAAVAGAVDELVRATQAACAAHGVTFLTTDLDKDGGKIILVAGAPTTTGDDEDRMIAAVGAVLDHDSPLSVRAGVNRGRVFAVDVGTDARRVYTVMGDAVNLAARVMGAAPDGRCLATITLLERLGSERHVELVEPFMVKGKSDPVSAAVVGEIVAASTRGRPAAGAPLVGREQERALLVGAVDAARAGHPTIVELVGEPGIGKSRLTTEMRLAAGDMTVVVIEGSQYASTTPYRAVRDAARWLLGLAAYAEEAVVTERLTSVLRASVPQLESWLPLLATPFGVALPDTRDTAALAPAFRRRRLEEVTTVLLAALLPPTGLLLVEDAHWLDEASADLVARFLERLQSRFHWATCVTRRPGPTTLDLSRLDNVTHLELGPLVESDAESLVAAAGAGRLSAREVRELVERSGGNPLFLHELATAAARGTTIDELPDTVEAVIAAHIDTLHPNDRHLLRAASVLGVRFPRQLLDNTIGDRHATRPSVLRRLDGLLRHDDDDRLRFRHALIREVAYEGLSFKRRRALHGRAAELVEAFAGADAEGASESLSLHYFAAGRHREAWHWSRVAGERARRQAAPAEAAAFFERALEAARPAGVGPEEVAETQEVLGDVYELGGRYDQATAAYRRARRLRAGDDLALANLLRKEGVANERAGHYRNALRWYTRGFQAVDRAGPSEAADQLAAQLHVAYGAVRVRQGRHRLAVPLLEQAVRLAEPLGARRTLAHAYYALDWAWTELGRPDSRYRELALPIFKELDDWQGQGSTLNNLGLGAYYEGRWREALEFWRQALEAFVTVGDVVQQATIANNIGEILSDQGVIDEAETKFRAALETWREADFLVGIGLASSNLGRAAARAGRFDEARELLAAAVEQLQAIGAGELTSEAHAREAERRLLAGDHHGALAVAESVRRQANRPVLVALVERLIGYAHAQAGDTATALDWLERSVATAEAIGAAYEVALGREAVVRITRLAGAAVPPDAVASEILERLGVVWTPQPPLPGLAAVVGRV